jgi:hypothetical protein
LVLISAFRGVSVWAIMNTIYATSALNWTLKGSVWAVGVEHHSGAGDFIEVGWTGLCQ